MRREEVEEEVRVQAPRVFVLRGVSLGAEDAAHIFASVLRLGVGVSKRHKF